MRTGKYPRAQSIAIALDTARRSAAKRAAGGGFTAPPITPYATRQAMREEDAVHPGGFFNSSVAGRTDQIPLSVASGGFIIPADVVSGLGQGNSLAGAAVLNKMFSTAPYGGKMPQMRGGGHRIPAPPAPFHQGPAPQIATGGKTDDVDENGNVPIVVAGGEFHVSADAVNKLGGGDQKVGHGILDAFVKHVRKKTIKTMSKLPGPKR